MQPQDVVIIGAGGFGREVLDVFDAVNDRKALYQVIGFIVDPQYAQAGTLVNDKPVLGGLDWFKGRRRIKAICAIGDPRSRFDVTMRTKDVGVEFCSVIHPTAVLTRWTSIGTGCVIAAGSILTSNITIGDHVHINLDCTVGHDVIMEDFSTLAPGVHISGRVRLDKGCYVGTGANVIEGIHAGAWSTIGAGSTIIENVPPGATVVGVPGKVIKIGKEG